MGIILSYKNFALIKFDEASDGIDVVFEVVSDKDGRQAFVPRLAKLPNQFKVRGIDHGTMVEALVLEHINVIVFAGWDLVDVHGLHCYHSFMDKPSLLASTVKTARFVFFGILIQSTLFSFWGLEFFITQPGPQTAPLLVYVVFVLMAVISFIYGIRFFQNYMKVRGAKLKAYEGRKLKETLLLVYAIHILLLEFVAIIGIMIAIFTQTGWLIYPFYFLFLIGMWFSYPQKALFENYFGDSTP